MSVNLEEVTKIYESRLINCWEHAPIVLAEGKGCIVKDVEGKEYIDCTAQAWTLSVGHSHPRVISAVKEQIDKLATAFFGYQNIPMLLLAEKPVEITPEKFNKVLFGLGGSTAIEAAIHLSMRYTQGQDILTLYHGYHGRTFATEAVSYTHDSFMHAKRGLEKFMTKPIRVPNAYCYRCYFDLT